MFCSRWARERRASSLKPRKYTACCLLVRCIRARHTTRSGSCKSNGVTCMTTELSPKRLELLHEAVPKASRVMFLHDPQAAPNAWKLTQEAAPRLRITLQQANVRAAEELPPELTVIENERPDALFVYPDVVFLSSASTNRRVCSQGPPAHGECVPLLRRRRGSNDLRRATASEIYRSAAEQVAKVLGDTRPSELPLREATRFELVINNWAAKALGITIPPVAAGAGRRGDRVTTAVCYTLVPRGTHATCRDEALRSACGDNPDIDQTSTNDRFRPICDISAQFLL